MLTERTVWLGATATAIGILLVMLLQVALERRDATTPRFDRPGIEHAAPWQSLDGCGPTITG